MSLLRTIKYACLITLKIYFKQPLIPITIALLSFAPSFIAYLFISSFFVPDRDADFLTNTLNLITIAIALFLCFIFYPIQISLLTYSSNAPFKVSFNKLKNLISISTIKFFILFGLSILLFFTAFQLILVPAGVLVILNIQSLVPFHSVLYCLGGIGFCYFLGVINIKLNESSIDEKYEIKTLILWFNKQSIKDEIYFMFYNIINGLILCTIIIIFINTMGDGFIMKLLLGFDVRSNLLTNIIPILVGFFILIPSYLISITIFNLQIKNPENQTLA